MTRSSAELRQDVEDARMRLAHTVGEIGGIVDETRTEAIEKAKQYAPYAAGVIGAVAILKVFRRSRSPHD